MRTQTDPFLAGSGAVTDLPERFRGAASGYQGVRAKITQKGGQIEERVTGPAAAQRATA